MTNKSYQRHRSYCRLFCYRRTGCDDGKVWYLFYEVGTHDENSGTSDQNKFHLNADFSMRGEAPYKTRSGLKHKYVITQIRKNKK